MAILFNCPYCTASIKVPDSASGKIGRCPKCETRVKVPVVDQPTVEEPLTNPPPAETASADPTGGTKDVTPKPPPRKNPPVAPVETPRFAAPPEDDQPPGEFDFNFDQPKPASPPAPSSVTPDGGVIVTDSAQEPSISTQLRNRRKGGWLKVMIPLLMAAILVGIGLGYMYVNQPTLTGTLTGEALGPTTLEKVISRNEIDISPNEMTEMLDQLREEPESLITQFRRMTIRGTGQGLGIGIRPGEKGMIVRVDLRKNNDLSDYLKEHAEQFHKPQKEQTQKAATQFLKDWQSSVGSGMRMGNLGSYMESLGSDALVAGLGYHTQASHGGKLYPCVYEDTEGLTYYLVPKGIERFTIVEREFTNRDESIFDREFKFDVNVKREKVEQKEAPDTAEPPEEESDPDADRNEG